MKSALLLLVFFTASALRAQVRDFLLPVHGDTLVGKVQPLTFGSFDQVQITLDGRKKVFNVIEVRAFRFEGILYKPIRLNNKYWFMQLLSSGYLSIYAFRLENSPHFDGRLLVTMDGRSLEVPNIGFKGTVADFLADCPEVSDRVRSAGLKKKELELIVKEYNDCKQERPNDLPITRINDSPELKALSALETKARELDFEGRPDALELLADIRAKLGRSERIPKYQLDALKSFFASNDGTKRELDEFLATLTY